MEIRRFYFLDQLRGLLVIFMVLYHYFFVLDFFYGISFVNFDNFILEIVANVARFLFIYLVGTNSAILYYKDKNSYFKKQFDRFWKILFCAILITIVTYIFVPDFYIFFGILHLISVSILLLAFIDQKFFLSIVILFILGINYLLDPNFNFLFKNIGLNSSLDYFPLLPWVIPSLLGFATFKIIYKFLSVYNFRFIYLENIGKYSLSIYMIHVPLFFLIIEILKLVNM